MSHLLHKLLSEGNVALIKAVFEIVGKVFGD